jgi:hypothetical protein
MENLNFFESDITEEKARKLKLCPKCQHPKSEGLVVCWNCFKYIQNPFKYSNLSLEEWLKKE